MHCTNHTPFLEKLLKKVTVICFSSCKILESEISPSGVVIATYGRAGEVKTGSFRLETPSVAELARRKRLKEEG